MRRAASIVRFPTPRLWVALAAVLTFASVPVAGSGQTTEPARTGHEAPAPSAALAAERFYLRAGVVLESSSAQRFKDNDCSSTSPAALYGCGNGVDGAPLSTRGEFETRAGVELGLGYRATPALRLEAMVQYRPRFSFKGRANFIQTTERQDVRANLSSVTGMLAVYVDLPALGLPTLGPLSPFIGTGAGVSHIRIGETRMEFPRTRTVVPGGRRTGLAWMAEAGVAAPVGERMTVELAWRYTDYGTVETGQGTGRIEYRDGRPSFPLPLARTRAALRRHGPVLSVRYRF